MKTRITKTLLISCVLASSVFMQPEPRPSPGGNGHGKDSGDDYAMSEQEQNVLLSCLAGYNFEILPPGIQKKLARGGTLPPGQAKKLRALPGSCTVRLPRLPHDVRRVIFGNNVIIVRGGGRILFMVTFNFHPN